MGVMDTEEAGPSDTTAVSTTRDTERAAALAAFHAALRHPDLHAEDELTRARALVAVADAKAAYAAAGGSPGSRFSESFDHVYEAARATVAAAG